MRRTGGRFDYALAFKSSAMTLNEDGTDMQAPDLVSAVKQHLGLELVPKKEALEIVIVDRVTRTPTQN
jgi:uncharacterized protein (TIGR03435 family)